VEELAEGRVWDGATAVQLGLVDKLGSLEDAVTAAADMVGLPEKQAAYIEGGESPAELLLKSLGMAESLLQTHRSPVQVLAESLLQRHAPAFNFLADGDPQNIYSHCLLPGSAFTF
jgi:protease-4